MNSLTRVFDFSASHRLAHPDWSDERNQQIFGKCSNSAGHGHNYVLEVTVVGPVNPDTRMIMDAAQLKELVRERVIHDVDHKCLNSQVPWLAGLIPTVEQLCESFWQRLEAQIGEICPGVTLMRIRLWETPRIYACKEV